KKKFYGWVVIALIGSYFLTFGLEQPNLDAGGMLVPAMLAILAAFSFGSSTVFSKKAITKVSHGLGTALRFFMTTGIMLIVIIVISILNGADFETGYDGFQGFSVISWSIIGVFIIIALTTGGTAIFIYYWGLKRVLASRATIFEMVFPVSAVLLEFIVHDQVLSAAQWMGAVIVVGAIWSILRLKREELQSN
ncbi:MAG: DMT family transporter, partial [Patescibacteria group bacterium]